MVFTIVVEIVILNCILVEGNSSIHEAVVVAPIVSFTTVTIAVLVGVFRGTRNDDVSRVPLSPVGRAVGSE